jgi:hypothetical protein
MVSMHRSVTVVSLWALVLLIACGGAPEKPLSADQQANRGSGRTSPSSPRNCEVAADLRKRVPDLLGKGKLNRTVRVIDKANRLCPESAPETWAAQVETLAELGLYAEARQVAREISSASEAPGAAKQAAKTALDKVERLDKTFPDTDEAKQGTPTS